MSIVGMWNVTVSTPMGEQAATLTFTDDGTGRTSSQLGSSDFADVQIDGDRATFTVKIDVLGQETVFAGSATADGDSIAGKYESAMGASEFRGRRTG